MTAKEKMAQSFLPGGSYWQSPLLGINFGPAKLTAKGEPQYQNFSTAKSWRILSKISSVKQLHQGALTTRSIAIYLFLESEPIFIARESS